MANSREGSPNSAPNSNDNSTYIFRRSYKTRRSGQEINMETTHHRQIEATQGQTQKIVLAVAPT